MSTCNPISSTTNCPCDEFVHPSPLVIDAGLNELPRQVATFPEFRRAMLRAISEYSPLANWAASKEEDLGVMLIEMWAYVCDVLAFYDGAIAHEAYLRTARLRPSVRKLVDLLGYIPRPATGAKVQLAALASGRQPVTLPLGTAFRSTAFDAEPPQLFELDAETVIHPFGNQFELLRPDYSTVGSHHPASLTVLPIADLAPESLVLIVNSTNSSQNSAHKIASQRRFTGEDEVVYTQLTLGNPSRLTSGTLLSNLTVYKPNNIARIYDVSSHNNTVGYGAPGDEFTIGLAAYSTDLYLDKQYDELMEGQYLIIQKGGHYYPAQIASVEIVDRVISAGNTIEINGSSFNVPDVKVKVTMVTLEGSTIYNAFTFFVLGTTYDSFIVHWGLQPAAAVVREPDVTVVAGDPLKFTKAVEQPIGTFEPTAFLLEDKNNLGQMLEGNFNAALDGMDVTDLSGWTQTLYSPVQVYANVIAASRGESVKNEILGSGNASTASQQFKLKKAPLTYFLSPTLDNDSGVTSTLEIYVDSIQWAEVTNFYLSGPEDPVYIVRQNDDGESIVTFGDGIRGSRLPTGRNNIIANYRFGAGAATPPAGGITQLGKPVAGLQSIVNPVAATAGADAEEQEEMRSYAPQSILILGRAVSMKDMEAVTLSVPGVRVAQAEWRWSANVQSAAAHIWYVGDPGLEGDIEARLRNVTAQGTPFDVQPATKRSIRLAVSVSHDPRYEPMALKAVIEEVLMAEKTGFLMPENTGVGQHFFRSQLFAAILSVPGTTGIQGISWTESVDPQPFTTYAKQQNAGSYWDFETYVPTITLSEDTNL
jgi:hypothetical protein